MSESGGASSIERVKRSEAEEDDGEHQRSLLSCPPRHPREDDGLGRPAGHESRPVERQRERDAREPDADRDEQRGDLGAHPPAEADAAEHDVRDGDSEHPRGRSLGRSSVVHESPSERRRKRCVQEKHRRGRDTQGRDGNAELVPDRRDDEETPVEREHRERQEEIVSVPRPVHELWRADQEGAEREPAPALPQKSSDRRDERDDHERQGQSRRLATDEDGCRECAQQGERGDELRSPPHGDRRAGPTHDSGDEEPGLLADDLLHGGRVRQRRVERGQRARDGGDRRVGLASPLVEKQASREKDRRAGERERDARLDTDPATIDGDDEEEDDSDDDREPAEPREDPSAEQIFERRLGSGGFGVGLIPHRLLARRGAGGGRGWLGRRWRGRRNLQRPHDRRGRFR